MLLYFNKILKIIFFTNIALFAYGVWGGNYDLIALSIINMILLTPAFTKEKDELK